jgi:hypothetical protein
MSNIKGCGCSGNKPAQQPKPKTYTPPKQAGGYKRVPQASPPRRVQVQPKGK